VLVAGWAGAWLYGHGCESGGVVLRPGPTTRIVCAQNHDAGGYCHEPLCPPASDGASCDEGRSWRPEDAHYYLRRQAPTGQRTYYNELLVDGAHWASALPHVIEAFIAGVDGGKAVAARAAHEDFLRTYQLSAEEVPIVAATCECGGPRPYAEATSVPYDPCASGWPGDGRGRS
jgi:hypothetical protein